MITKIRTEAQYGEVMKLIEKYLAKATKAGGFSELNKTEREDLQKLSLLAEDYEDNMVSIMPLPLTLKAVVKNKIDEMNINQAKLAEILGLGTAKLSQILNGKRQPDVPFLKALHSKLGISGDFLLESV
ncbi:helix-turn-helix domain-containing protein [Pedobacter sp. SL55]|uniref:helix-turn-helix domain-containing protein n=1 Tax=Pedobacter sp. SL55 TaxID=2995161 RepID=UPI00226FE778|nr:helix-turn-helix domain-containing protein [Pedobacter sp. SL55]WAC39227.1 helix-turn-helix domain-containing protein [Pedobacter sp. SL55]